MIRYGGGSSARSIYRAEVGKIYMTNYINLVTSSDINLQQLSTYTLYLLKMCLGSYAWVK